MKERNTLIDLVKTIQKTEKEALRAFVRNPPPQLGEQSQDTGRLLDIILNTAPGFDETQLRKKNLYEQLFPSTPWAEGRLKKVMIALHKQIQAFLLVQHYLRKENAFARQMDLCDIFQSRGLKQRYDQQMRNVVKHLEEIQDRDANFFYHKFQIAYAQTNNALGNNQTHGDLNIESMLKSLAIFYHTRRLEIVNFFLNQQKFTHLDTSPLIQHAIFETSLPDEYLDDAGDLFIQQKIFNFLWLPNPSAEDFRELTRILKQREKDISSSVLQNSYTILRNFCHLLFYKGLSEYQEVLHELHKDNLARGYLYHPENENKIPSTSFLNIVNVGLITKHYDWVKNFLETHRTRILGDNEGGDFFQLNMAAYLFATGRYEEALEILPHSFPNIIYHLMARRLEIKIYYELHSDLLEFKLDAFKMYISRASKKFLTNAFRERNADFVNLLAQIIQSKPGDLNRRERLTKRINERVWVAERNWLLEKVQQMK